MYQMINGTIPNIIAGAIDSTINLLLLTSASQYKKYAFFIYYSEKIAEKTLDQKELKELREHGIKPRDKKAVEAYFAEKKRRADEAAAKAKAEADEKSRIEREQNPTAEELLKKILEVISK